VTRGNFEASLTTHGFTVFGDFTHQHGNHVVDFPLPGSTSSDIDYLMSGVSYQWDDFTLRYSYSFGDYKDDDVKEDLHLPGVVYQLNKNISIWLEYVYWNRDTSGNSAVQDRSLNLMLYASF
jgi:predicted porin